MAERTFDPPLVEVVCGVQFPLLERFSSVHFGKFWDHLGPEYVSTEDQAPLSQLSEAQPDGVSTAAVLPAPPLRRVFYISRDGNFVYQVQPTRFLSNWRRQQPTDSYPRFEIAFERFRYGRQLFQTFLSKQSLGDIVANHYELTYINHIPEGKDSFPIGIEKYLPVFGWSHAMRNTTLEAPRAAALNLVFPLGKIKGNLYVTAQHGLRAGDKRNILVLEITARGPADERATSMNTWFGVAHETAVHAFKDLTASSARMAWGWPE